ncbi:MAG: phage terminase large subunit [Ignavibacteriales bacterium]|nr:phage terminase large subunit [Ignavibacteriales bacterium]
MNLKRLSPRDKAALLRLVEIEVNQRDFYSFCVAMDPGFFTPGKWHLKLIAARLQQLADGKINKLMISLPPRAGKSYIVSMFCAWLIGKTKNPSIMRNGYGELIANKFSYDIRAIIQKSEYLEIFPHVKLKKDKGAIADWAIEGCDQSTYFCAGVGGSITGKGCRTLAVLDDPIKNFEDATSEVILDKTWNWYGSTHLSRLEGDCPQLQIATRWSKKDPIGQLLETEGSKWEKIVIPALDECGRSFCDEIKTTEQYLDIKNVLAPMIWEAEFMQEPIEAKGLLFPIGELKRFSLNDLKSWDAVIGYVDVADEGTDYLAALIGKLSGKKIYITDVVFTQEDIRVTEALVAQQLLETWCNDCTVESNNGGKGFALNVEKLLRKTISRCSINWIANTDNKVTRIIMKAGMIKEYFYFRDDYEPGSHYDVFMRQLTSYVLMGKNKHDDAPDVVTGLAEKLEGFGPPEVFSANTRKTKKILRNY